MMFEKINKIIEKRFFNGDYIAINDENGVHILEVIEEMLENDEAISDYSVDYDEVFDYPGISIYYVSIACIENGKLEHVTYIAESR